MKKIFTCLFIIYIGILFANPIVPYLNITEITFNNSDWQMELYSDFLGEYTNLDSCQIVCSTGSSYFQAGIEYELCSYLEVNNADLITPLSINPENDSIRIYLLSESYSYLEYGTLTDMVLAPSDEQSLRSVGLSINAMDTYYIFAKDNTPSMGEQDDGEGYKGMFHGYVYDAVMNPIANVLIEHTPDCISFLDIVTDDNGYFEVELYAFNYDCNIHLGTLASMDSIITIEPDIQNYYEFVFENYVSSDDIEIELPPSHYNLSNYPNPFNPSTTISFDLTSEIAEDTEIQIFNSKGQKIRQFPIFNEQSSITWDGTNSIGRSCPSGVYLYKLVSNGKELAVNKMLLLK